MYLLHFTTCTTLVTLKDRLVFQANLPTRTWAVTPESPAALNPPSADDEQRSVEFHPLVTCHVFRPR